MVIYKLGSLGTNLYQYPRIVKNSKVNSSTEMSIIKGQLCSPKANKLIFEYKFVGFCGC